MISASLEHLALVLSILSGFGFKSLCLLLLVCFQVFLRHKTGIFILFCNVLFCFLFRWLLPFIGHMGICTSTGVIRDFAGPYFVSVSKGFSLAGFEKILELVWEN